MHHQGGYNFADGADGDGDGVGDGPADGKHAYQTRRPDSVDLGGSPHDMSQGAHRGRRGIRRWRDRCA